MPPGHVSLYGINVDRSGSGVSPSFEAPNMIYTFMTKDGTLDSFKTISTEDYMALDYGDEISGTMYPYSASIVREFYPEGHSASIAAANAAAIDQERRNMGLGLVTGTPDGDSGGGLILSVGMVGPDGVEFDRDTLFEGTDGTSRTSYDRYRRLKTLLTASRVQALENVLNHYRTLSPHYAYSSTLGDKDQQAINLINIPSIFYGSSIKKGSVSLKYYITGTLAGELQDSNYNGELIQVSGAANDLGDTYGSASVAGVVLYNEGVILLTGSWKLDPNNESKVRTSSLDPDDVDFSKWIYWGLGANDGISGSATVGAAGNLNQRNSSSFDLSFQGTNYVPVVTMLAHARKGHLNYTTNPTAIQYTSSAEAYTARTASYMYKEPELDLINTFSSSFDDPTGSYVKQTFISKVAIYDDDKNLIGIATVNTPVKKTEEQDYTFKLKLDI
tara:strand:- start:948 stop:2282 length:1335 start_codon:yes stop_codon:yes gene_type:complete